MTTRHIAAVGITLFCVMFMATNAHARHHNNSTVLVEQTFSVDLITKARHYAGMTASQIGLHRHSLWCAAFIRHLGINGPVDDRAISFLKLPHVNRQIGAIAVYAHHVGIVTGFDANGNPIIISGNSYQRRVYEGPYPRRPLAYVIPG